MGALYSSTSVTNYNSNPPSDDGATTDSNKVKWSTQKTKLTDPLKTAFDSSETATATAFTKPIGGNGFLNTAVDYTVLAADQGKCIRCTVSGKTITTPDATVVGSPFWFMVKNASTGNITLDGNGAQTVDGVANVTIPPGVGCLVGTDGSNWHSDGIPSVPLTMPQGYLTLVSGTTIITSDQTAKTVVYYTPHKGGWTPIHNGTQFIPYQFSELSLTLTSSQAANGIYDIFLAYNSGTPVIGTGPSWSAGTSGSVTPGSCARGTGTGGTALTRLNGVYVNAADISLIWNTGSGNTTITVTANQGVYLGSIWIDATAGQVSCHRTFGQNRKNGIWNAYNRETVTLLAGDSTASWTYATAAYRASNNTPAAYSANAYNVGSGTACNGLTIFSGLAEESANIEFSQVVELQPSGVSQDQVSVGIGVNSITAQSGMIGHCLNGISEQLKFWTITARHTLVSSLGLNNITSLENTINHGTSETYEGTSTNMMLRATWKG